MNKRSSCREKTQRKEKVVPTNKSNEEKAYLGSDFLEDLSTVGGASFWGR